MAGRSSLLWCGWTLSHQTHTRSSITNTSTQFCTSIFDGFLCGAPTIRYAYLQGRALIPIDTLLTVNGRSPYYHDQDKVQIFYGEAWALVHFLTFGPGMLGTTKLTQFNNLLQQGTEQKKAFQQVFGDTADLQKKLDEYVHHPAFTTGVIETPPKLDEKEFPVRALSMAETESQLGSYHLWSYHLPEARQYIQQAVKDDPKLGFAHENMGFLDFRDGKDEEAAREFSQAYELDNSLYLSLFYMTMLSGVTRSDKPADQASLHEHWTSIVSLHLHTSNSRCWTYGKASILPLSAWRGERNSWSLHEPDTTC